MNICPMRGILWRPGGKPGGLLVVMARRNRRRTSKVVVMNSIVQILILRICINRVNIEC